MRGYRQSRSTMARSVVGYLALATLLIALTGCGAGVSTGGTSTGPTSTPGAAATGSTSSSDNASQDSTAQDSTTQDSTTHTSPSTKKPKTNVIDWILRLGVGSPTGPAFDYLAHYEALRKQDCQAALGDGDGVQVVAAAAKACLAAQGSPDAATLWSEAATALDGFHSGSLNCLDDVAYGLLDQLVTAHVQHPDRTFQFVTGGQDQGDPQCPALTGSKPDAGSSGDVVTLKGIRLSSVDQVAVRFGDGDAQPVTPFDLTNTRMKVTMPQADDGAVATIEVTSPRLPWTMTAQFRYRSVSSSSPPSSPETSSSASASAGSDHGSASDSSG